MAGEFVPAIAMDAAIDCVGHHLRGSFFLMESSPMTVTMIADDIARMEVSVPELRDAFLNALAACDPKESRTILQNIHLTWYGATGLELWATDGKRLSRTWVQGTKMPWTPRDAPIFDLLLHHDVVKEIASELAGFKGSARVDVMDGDIEIEVPSKPTISGGHPLERFPKLRGLIPHYEETFEVIVEDAADLIRAVKAAQAQARAAIKDLKESEANLAGGTGILRHQTGVVWLEFHARVIHVTTSAPLQVEPTHAKGYWPTHNTAGFACSRKAKVFAAYLLSILQRFKGKGPIGVNFQEPSRGSSQAFGLIQFRCLKDSDFALYLMPYVPLPSKKVKPAKV